MNSSKRGVYLVVASIILTALLIVSELWSVEPAEVLAGVAADSEGYLPVILGDEAGPVRPTTEPTETPEETSTPEVTETPEITETPEVTETPEITETPEATATEGPTETPTETPSPTETPIPTSTPDGELPVIVSFSAFPSTVIAGETTTFSWEVTSLGHYTLLLKSDALEDPIDVFGLDEVEVTVPETPGNYEYRLIAEDGDGKTKAFQTIEVVVGLPELLMFDWNKEVKQSDNGFPDIKADQMPPGANDDWTTPIDYANGTLYFRSIVSSQQVPHKMKLQYCMWQPVGANNHAIESCGRMKLINALSGTSTDTWDTEIGGQGWYDQTVPIDWSQPRWEYAFVVKTEDGCPVTSRYVNIAVHPQCPVDPENPGEMLDWAGEDPGNWYPMGVRFTVVAVPKGGTFSGWQNYP